MKALSKDKIEKLRKDCAGLLRKDEAGCDTRTILKNMYCENYSGKTEDIGYLMGDKVLGYVREYEREVLQAMEDVDGWYEEKVQAVLQGKKSCEDRCNTLYRVRVGLAAAELSISKGKEAAEAYVEEHSGKAFTAEESTEELEAKLKEELKRTLGNNGLLASALNAFAENAADAADDIEHTVIRYGEDASRLKAVLAMKAYNESGADGYLADAIPADATLQDITYSVCAGVDMLGVAAAVGNGVMEDSQASRIIHVIGMVLGGIVALKIAAVVGGSIMAVSVGSVITFAGGVLAAFIVLDTMGEALVEIGGKAADITKDAVCFGVRCVSAAGRAIFASIRKIVDFIGELIQQFDWQKDVQGVVKYTEPVQERKPEAVQEVMPAPTVLA